MPALGRLTTVGCIFAQRLAAIVSGTTLSLAAATLACARAAACLRSYASVYLATSRKLRWPEIAMISCTLQSLSAISLQPALRNPCGLHDCGSPASSHHLRNCVLKAFLLNGWPHSLTKNVSEVSGAGHAAMAALTASGNGVCTSVGLRRLFFSWV